MAKWLSVIDTGTAKSLGLKFTDLRTKNRADVTFFDLKQCLWALSGQL